MRVEVAGTRAAVEPSRYLMSTCVVCQVVSLRYSMVLVLYKGRYQGPHKRHAPRQNYDFRVKLHGVLILYHST